MKIFAVDCNIKTYSYIYICLQLSYDLLNYGENGKHKNIIEKREINQTVLRVQISA